MNFFYDIAKYDKILQTFCIQHEFQTQVARQNFFDHVSMRLDPYKLICVKFLGRNRKFPFNFEADKAEF